MSNWQTRSQNSGKNTLLPQHSSKNSSCEHHQLQAFCGIYIISACQWVIYVYIAHKVSFLGTDGEMYHALLVQGSNTAHQVCQEIALVNISTNIIVLHFADNNSIQALLPKNAGKVFTMVDIIAMITTLELFLLEDGTKFYLLILPACLPILYGTAGAYKGALGEGCIDTSKTNTEGIGLWA